jgi:hypothetical protein
MGKEAKAKAPKDPNAPKKPLGAYMLFSKDMRKVVMEENPSAGFGEVGKILGAKWKECDEKTKKVRPVVWQRVGNTAWEGRQGLGGKCGPVGRFAAAPRHSLRGQWHCTCVGQPGRRGRGRAGPARGAGDGDDTASSPQLPAYIHSHPPSDAVPCLFAEQKYTDMAEVEKKKYEQAMSSCVPTRAPAGQNRCRAAPGPLLTGQPPRGVPKTRVRTRRADPQTTPCAPPAVCRYKQ